MILICLLNYPKYVEFGVRFKIRYKVFYFTLPFRYIYTDVWKDGKLIGKEKKRVIFPIGLWGRSVSSSIWKQSQYKINCGYIS